MLTDYPAGRPLLCLRYGIGDVLMERPALEALRQALPEARITALGAEPATELLEGDPVVDEIRSIQQFGLSHRWDRGSESSRAALQAWLEEKRFDLFLDVRHSATAVGRVVWSLGIRSLEAREGAEVRALRAGANGVEAILAGVRAGWGLEIDEPALPNLPLSHSERTAAAAFLDRHHVDGRPLVGISPVASNTLKRWPVERFARTADALSRDADAQLLLFCGPDPSVADEMTAGMTSRDVPIRVGAVHLRTIAALLARCSVFLGNDTGLMHLAAAVGTPTIGIFGPTAPSLYRPPHEHAGSIGTEEFCPHRNLDSLHPPACFRAGHCLVSRRGCIEAVTEAEVLWQIRARVRSADALHAAG